MRQKSMSKNDPAEGTVRDIRRKTGKQYTEPVNDFETPTVSIY